MRLFPLLSQNTRWSVSFQSNLDPGASPSPFLSLTGTCNGNRCLEAQPGFLYHKESFHSNHQTLPMKTLGMQPGNRFWSKCIWKTWQQYLFFFTINNSEYSLAVIILNHMLNVREREVMVSWLIKKRHSSRFLYFKIIWASVITSSSPVIASIPHHHQG